eukprot:TRINITY_DN1760_c0_g2_i1.p2 TRINITY_DN1760_c0_g2~~TRINITY_DN1760_c0_g2_i1.p2  ORF type:complete len:123 (-),score=9.34 TRINITY_DN1760_c0_g2_i1:179-547(-)
MYSMRRAGAMLSVATSPIPANPAPASTGLESVPTSPPVFLDKLPCARNRIGSCATLQASSSCTAHEQRRTAPHAGDRHIARRPPHAAAALLCTRVVLSARGALEGSEVATPRRVGRADAHLG